MFARRLSLFVVAFCLAVSSLSSTARVAVAQPSLGADEGRPQIAWQEASQFVGKAALVSGKVIGVPTVGQITFINFDEQRPVRFAGVIRQESLTNFPKPPKEMYDGKIVQIRGTVSVYRDQPQIMITSPAQIEVLDKLPGKTD